MVADVDRPDAATESIEVALISLFKSRLRAPDALAQNLVEVKRIMKLPSVTCKDPLCSKAVSAVDSMLLYSGFVPSKKRLTNGDLRL